MLLYYTINLYNILGDFLEFVIDDSCYQKPPQQHAHSTLIIGLIRNELECSNFAPCSSVLFATPLICAFCSYPPPLLTCFVP